MVARPSVEFAGVERRCGTWSKTIAFGICTSNVVYGLQRVAFGNREHAAKACHWLEGGGVASIIFGHLTARPWRS